MYYEMGVGVKADTPVSVEWYKKAARQLKEGKWAEGYIVGATGAYGYFGQKYDALIAQYRLADIYSSGNGIDKDLVLAHLLISNVIDKSNGEPQIFFCCDWSGGRWFRQTQFTELKQKIEKEMTEEQLKKVNEIASHWSVNNDL